MRTLALLALLIPVLAAPTRAQQEKESPWIADFELARSRARVQEKDLLLVFMAPAADGSDQKLEQEILDGADFVTSAGERFVLARFDYPADPNGIPEVLRPQYAQLRHKYAAPRLPVVWLADRYGHAYARLGYRPGGSVAFLAALVQKQQAHAAAAAAMERAAGLRGTDRAKALAEALRHLDDNIVATVHHRELLEVLKADPDGALGFREEFDAIARDGAMLPFLIRVQDDVRPLVDKGDWEAVAERAEALREHYGEVRWARQYATFLEGLVAAGRDADPAAALAKFEAARALAPRSEVADEIDRHRQQAEAAVAAAAEQARKEAEAAKKAKKKGKR